jgi:long-chain acyl-CoA synthetase
MGMSIPESAERPVPSPVPESSRPSGVRPARGAGEQTPAVGPGSFPSVAAMFRDRVERTPEAEAFYAPRADGGWDTFAWKDVGEQVRALASGLRAVGLEDEDRVAILSATRMDWILADLSILCAGCATTTIYPSNTADECAFILNDSAARLVFAENEEQLNKLRSVRQQIPQVLKVVLLDGHGDGDWAISMQELRDAGRAYDAGAPDEYDARIDRIGPERLATLIYTSGTTGRPKGVELTHDCWVYTGDAVTAMEVLTPEDKQYLWLPLAHSFGKVLEVVILRLGIPTAVDGRVDKIVENLAVVQPTFMAAAPRIFEKVYNKVVTGAEEAGGAKYAIFKWAMKVGYEVSRLRQQGQQPKGWLAFKYRIADKLVFRKLRDRFGGKIRFFISGSAPLSRQMAEFFHAAGILILEGYGLTESSAASFVNRPESYRFGTVGPPLEGTEVRIAEDGEVLIRSRGVMRGYHNLPETTAETLQDGWLHTGDVGEVDEAGRLRITDRKKDLIKTSGGKYVAPQHIESKLKAECPYLSNVLVHGNRRNFCTALVTLDADSIKAWAAERGLSQSTPEQLAEHPDVHAMVKSAVDRMNSGLASYESIKDFAILPRDLSIESGELTPSLKVKRKVVEQRYAHILDGFYADSVKAL